MHKLCICICWALIWHLAFAYAELKPRKLRDAVLESAPNTCDADTVFEGHGLLLRRNPRRAKEEDENWFWKWWNAVKRSPETPLHDCPPKKSLSKSSTSTSTLTSSTSSTQELSPPQASVSPSTSSLTSSSKALSLSVPSSTSISEKSSLLLSNSQSSSTTISSLSKSIFSSSSSLLASSSSVETLSTSKSSKTAPPSSTSTGLSQSQSPTSGPALTSASLDKAPKRPPPQNEPTPLLCKTTLGDSLWPTYDVWKSYMPKVTEIPVQGKEAHPNYLLVARSVADVQAAVLFTSKYNIRLSIISSGLDYLGRNDAPNGLLLSVKYLKGLRVLEAPVVNEEGFEEVIFTDDPSLANVVSWKTRQRFGVSFGAGVTTQELNDALEPSNLFTIAAAHGNISVAGGWLQGGGHGPFSHDKLGVEEVLEFQVVTADGKLKVANSMINRDLFWALKGGGGSTFGIVVQATLNAWPDTNRAVFSAWLNTTSSAPPDSIYAISLRCFEELESLSNGLQGYCFIYPKALRILAWPHPSGLHDERIPLRGHRRSWLRSIRRLQSLENVASVIHEEIPYGSFKELFDGTFGMKNHDIYQADDKCKRKLEWHPSDYECKEGMFRRARFSHFDHLKPGSLKELDPPPNGITQVDSWLLARIHLRPRLANILKASMPRNENGQLMEDVPLRVSFTYNSTTTGSTNISVHPLWRRSAVLVSGTNLTALKSFAPTMGAYLNEASIPQQNWKQTFWGKNYNTLLKIKHKYDPDGLFYATPGIGADEWFLDASRLCRRVRERPSVPVSPSSSSTPSIDLDPSVIDPEELGISASSTDSIMTGSTSNSAYTTTVTQSFARTLLSSTSNFTTITSNDPTLMKPSVSVAPSTTFTTQSYASIPGFPNARPIPSGSVTVSAAPKILPIPEGDNTNTNTAPLAQFLLPAPFFTPWPINQVAADNFQRTAASRLSSMREVSARERGSFISSCSALASSTTFTSLVSAALTPTMPAWSPYSRPTSVRTTGSSGFKFTIVPWEKPSVSFISSTSSSTTSKSFRMSSTTSTTGKPGVMSVSGPGGRPAQRNN